MKQFLRVVVAPGLVVAVAAGVAACGLRTPSALVKSEPAGKPVPIAALWVEPADIAKRDLYFGPGGKSNAPRGETFEYVQGESLLSWGYDVKDPQGQEWSVKFGVESQAEVAVSRLLWAIGYHQPPTYYVDAWALTGRHDGPQPPGRFRLERPVADVVDVWDWYENPFVGSREFAGLIVANIIFNNWDLKAQNNKIYEYKEPVRGVTRAYVVRDVGASFGKTRRPWDLRWLWDRGSPQGTKNSVEDFESEGFIIGVEGDRVLFDMNTGHRRLLESLTVADVRWTCELLNRLSREQMLDAFRAANYDAAVAERFVQKIRAKVDQGLKVGANATAQIRRTP
jgi:hypothetical protein